MVRCPAVLFAAVFVSVPALASPSARLIYSRPPEAATCPDEEAVRAAVAARLGYDPFFPWAPTTVVVDVTRTDSRFRADVRLIDEHGLVRGARHLETKGSECTDLMAAMALTISIVVDPLSLTSASPVPQSEDSTTTLPVADPPQPPPSAPVMTPLQPPPPAPPLPDPIHAYAGAGVLGSVGTAPAVSFGGDLLVGVRQRALSLEVDVRGELPASRALAAGTVQTERLIGSLVPCLHLGVSLFCAVGSVAWVHASGSGLTEDGGGSAIAGALGVRAGVELRLGPIVRIRGYADLLAELFPPQLQIGTTNVYPLSPVSGDLGLAALVQFF
jgi:hypothetical protein